MHLNTELIEHWLKEKRRLLEKQMSSHARGKFPCVADPSIEKIKITSLRVIYVKSIVAKSFRSLQSFLLR